MELVWDVTWDVEIESCVSNFEIRRALAAR